MLQVTCAVICNAQNEILAVQRSEKMRMPLKWEFPGGKLEAGETEAEGLSREIREELALNIQPEIRMQPVHHDYGAFTICLIPYWARIGKEEVKLKEHLAYRWILPKNLPGLDWAAADLPVVQQILNSKPWFF
ncbi:(deoxy)nucleoside triphosphate pyrophosphohydrolase [Cyclobacterium plantarum]|uniref:8-oxo-dGTP diphosphatase n=1 Tax=Cyclobacterium plantarum TaxID=2716263 RepID=A0ABX0HD95_9BACT|nr:(deoxy)nucleoside triphosphate pyrophosphohydrolase [Cyclobacterium plantarum]NHE59743.1 (deoxy)nucleoside triphosphate pyrophosphohydrolase [Cyclobacterium plantarum]